MKNKTRAEPRSIFASKMNEYKKILPLAA